MFADMALLSLGWPRHPCQTQSPIGPAPWENKLAPRTCVLQEGQCILTNYAHLRSANCEAWVFIHCLRPVRPTHRGTPASMHHGTLHCTLLSTLLCTPFHSSRDPVEGLEPLKGWKFLESNPNKCFVDSRNAGRGPSGLKARCG